MNKNQLSNIMYKIEAVGLLDMVVQFRGNSGLGRGEELVFRKPQRTWRPPLHLGK